jgi:hypothetical protein
MLKVDDEVVCHDKGSWTDGLKFVVKKLFVTSSDGIKGHLLQGSDGVTVQPEHCLTLVDRGG